MTDTIEPALGDEVHAVDWRARAERAERERDEAVRLLTDTVDELAREHEREVAELRTERAEANLALGRVAAALGLREDADLAYAVESLERGLDAAHHRVRHLTEVVGYWERGATARLLGIAPDQLATVRGVLRGLAAFMDQYPGIECDATARAWDAAGRPLGDAGNNND